IIRMLFCPFMIPSCMISDPIDNNFKTLFMCFFHKNPEIIQRTKFSIDGSIIGSSVVASEHPFLVFLSNWSNGHEPESFYTHLFQPWQFFTKGLKASFLCILANIYFIYIRAPYPI